VIRRASRLGIIGFCRGGRMSYPIPITEEFVRGLLKQGYLWPNERDDLDAIHQAMSLFLWDSFRGLSKP
jgi:dienelactone hydrolase